MTDMHASPDRVVWFDLPVADLERAMKFYGAVLGIKVQKESFESSSFAVLEHGGDGNGGCLVPNAREVSAAGILVYMNVDGRIREAVRQTQRLGGKIVEPVKPIGPHGFRAVIIDSEGNRIALHSNSEQ
jgi:uncharacterized protein